jgi:hypothetical protein
MRDFEAWLNRTGSPRTEELGVLLPFSRGSGFSSIDADGLNPTFSDTSSLFSWLFPVRRM